MNDQVIVEPFTVMVERYLSLGQLKGQRSPSTGKTEIRLLGHLYHFGTPLSFWDNICPIPHHSLFSHLESSLLSENGIPDQVGCHHVSWDILNWVIGTF